MSRRSFLSLFLVLGLIGCSPAVKDGQPAASDQSCVLRAGQSVGQTFVARDDGLAGVEVFLAPAAPGAGQVLMHLRSSALSSTDLAEATLPLQVIVSPGFYSFTFLPQSNSQGESYYFRLEMVGEGQVRIGSAPGDAYLDGALYKNDTPEDSQVAFQLLYDVPWLAVGLARAVGSWLWLLGIGILLFIVPGWVMLTALLPRSVNVSWMERVGIAGGLSIALYPLLLLWTDLVGWHWGPFYAWLPVLAAVGVLLWRFRSWRPRGPGPIRDVWPLAPETWSDLALLFVIGLVLFGRFWAVRSLTVPMWGDSYQHTLIAQLLVDHGGLFNSWQPYAELQTLTYHFGFHAAVAAWHWMTGLPLASATLWTGQILNGLAVLALYPLAVRVGGSRWAGVGAVAVAGLLSPMPMYYVNWGRYTQLAGQAVLPGAICLAWIALELKDRSRGLVILVWVIFGGLALTHFRVLIFAILFFPALLLLQWRRVRVLVSRTVLLGIGGALLFLPWFFRTFAGEIMHIFTTQLTTPADAVASWVQESNTLSSASELLFYLPAFLWLLLPLGVGWGLFRRKQGVGVMALWWLFILLVANPALLALPGTGAINNFTVLIAFYFPAAILVGSLLGEVVGTPRVTKWAWSMPVLVLLVGSIGLWGARQRLGDLQVSQSALVTSADLRAAAWVRQDTPTDARFLVNSFFAYGGTVVVGSDAGWWLPLLAGRATTLPPLTYAAEQGPRPDYREWVNSLTAEIRDNGITNADTIAQLRARGVKYLYIGQRHGQINYDGSDSLKPAELLSSPFFQPVYNQDRVWVFEITN